MHLLTPDALMALLTLTLLEIILGIDNIIFIAVIVAKLPRHLQNRGRILGLSLAMLTRIALLLSLFWIMKLTKPLFVLAGNEISGRDLILLLGGLFLIYKSTVEIHELASAPAQKDEPRALGGGGFAATLVQIALLDIVFSLDSVITAVGMAQDVEIMIAAIVIAVGVMMFASKAISRFVDENPTVKMLALAFLLLVGISLIADGLDVHIPKGYIYFSMLFSLAVETLNIIARKKRQ
ncbi:MAG: TerC family protein [Helicobacteraceae bacterium]